jgi:hypothetical protein
VSTTTSTTQDAGSEVAAKRRKPPALPLAERDAVTLPEAASLGYGSERALRQMIATDKLKRCVLRVGKRGVRLLRSALAAELQELQARS